MTTSDADLLTSFIAHRDESAFAQIVQRYGSMVMATAKRFLKQEQDAEDAFQAVFLALAQGATAIRHKETLAAWLHQAAERTACSIVRSNRRWERKVNCAQKPMHHVLTNNVDDMMETLLRELHHLPRKYRVAIILCDIEGLSRKQAAAQLGMSAQTVTTQLSRGRTLLKRRLTRVGVTVSVAAVMQNVANAAIEVDTALASRTINNAVHFVAGKTTTEIGVSSTVVHLANLVTRNMAMAKYGSIGIVAFVLIFSIGSLAFVKERLSRFTGAQTVFYSDFGDGTDDGWIRVDNTAGPWAPGIFDASSGSYVLATSDSVATRPVGITDTLFAILESSTDLRFSNGVFRARVRAESVGTRFMLILRQSGGSGYAFSGGPGANNFEIDRVDNTATVVLEKCDTPLPAIAVGEAWFIEAGAVGDQLFMTFWREVDPKPSVPQLRAVDSSYSQGNVGIGIRKDSQFQSTGLLRATFDDISFRAGVSNDSIENDFANCPPNQVRRASHTD